MAFDAITRRFSSLSKGEKSAAFAAIAIGGGLLLLVLGIQVGEAAYAVFG
jgi:hypothetical protein